VWDICHLTRVLLVVLNTLKQPPSARKHRLAHCGFARSHYKRRKNPPLLKRAVEEGERWADSVKEPPNAELIHRKVHRLASKESEDWVAVARWCVSPLPLYNASGLTPDKQQLLADYYRDVFVNPFAQPEWKPEWFTSTVRDLSAHIYSERKFELLPILADALQDAGCDNAHIRNHCHSTKPHARGCWVVDTILGKA
jgi:hypothetical protein